MLGYSHQHSIAQCVHEDCVKRSVTRRRAPAPAPVYSSPAPSSSAALATAWTAPQLSRHCFRACGTETK